MKAQKPAFTLIEVIIALSLSCVVVYGMMQAYYNLQTYLQNAREILDADRKICLLFNQLEKDISTAFIPPVYKEELPVNPEGGKPEKPEDLQQEKQKEEQQKQEKLKTYFVAHKDDQEAKKFDERSVHLFKSLAIINTNPLQGYGQQGCRLVRVQYELVLDKEKPKNSPVCYKLIRKETTDLDNGKMKVKDVAGGDEKEKSAPVIMQLIADNVKGLYVQYVFKKADTNQPDQDNQQQEKEEEKFFDMWGQSKETKGIVPVRVQLSIELWDSKLQRSRAYSTAIAVFSYPTRTDKQASSQAQQGSQDNNAAAQQPAQQQQGVPPATNQAQQAQQAPQGQAVAPAQQGVPNANAAQ